MPSLAMPQPNTVDFETIGIEQRPHYPPSPVGVSIKYWRKKARYYGWGHITGGNNCTYGQAKAALAAVYNHRAPLLFHHAKFDTVVAEEHFGFLVPSWEKIHDSLFLLFLDDPRQRTFSLKPSAERLLDQPAEERDLVEEWLVEHQPVPGIKITRGRGKHGAGKYIAYAPGDIVGPYANGDTDRTEGIFRHLWQDIKSRGMLESYDRERRTLQVLIDIEKPGVQTDYHRLSRDVNRYNEVRDRTTEWVCKRLKKPYGDIDLFNPDSDKQLLAVLLERNKVDETRLLLTDKGNQSASKESLEGAMTDKVLQQVLAYRSELNTCLGTFMENWLYTAGLNSERRIYTDWNQVRQDHRSGKGTVGASTGRLSSSPNFQNISNAFDPHFKHLVDSTKFKNKAAYHKAVRDAPKCPIDLPHLPLVRSYVVAFPGDVLIDRDYSQQELRILGHYDWDEDQEEPGALQQAYLENPWLDVHDWATEMINLLLKSDYERRPIKDVGFGIVYGLGVGNLAKKVETNVTVAKVLKKAYLTIMPGLDNLYKDMRRRSRDDEPIYTWGGREYYCEEPRWIKNRLRKFDYKLVNLLIQGSAADCTKDAFIEYHRIKPKEHRLILNVHDQLTASVPKRQMAEGMEIMRVAMESVKFSIPMLSEGSWSDTNWDKSSLIDYDKKGVILHAA